MPKPFDHSFGQKALARKLLSPIQLSQATRIQTAMQEAGLSKSVADVCVEMGTLPHEAAAGLVGEVNKSGVRHPALSARTATREDRALAEKAIAGGKLDPAKLKECEELSVRLGKLGFRRSRAELLLDKGYVGAPRPRPRLQPAAVPAKKKSNTPVIIGVAIGAVVLIAVIVALATGKSPAPQPEPVVEKPTPRPAPQTPRPEPGPTPRPRPDPKPDPSVESAEQKMAREIEQARKEWEADQKRKVEAREKKKLDEQKTTETADEPPPKVEDTPAKKDLARAYETRKKERRDESVKQLQEAIKTIDEDRKAEVVRQKELLEKMKNQQLSVKLKNNMVLDNVIMQGMTRDEIKLSFTYEGATAEQSFPVDFIDNKSYAELVQAVFKGGGAAGYYEIGRHFIMRKMWKEAQTAFEACLKADASYKDRIPDLTAVLRNEAAFKGSARKVGTDQLLLSYDFTDAAQAQDFTVRQPGTLTVEGNELKMTSRGAAVWSLKDVEFEQELQVDAIVNLDEPAALMATFFYTWDRKGYLATLNSKAPPGHVFYRSDTTKVDVVVSTQEHRIPAGADVRLRLSVKGGVYKVFIGDQEALSMTDMAQSKGWFGLGVAGGTVRFKKLMIQGRVNPAEIQKRFAEAEVLVRRALEADLVKKKKKKDGDGMDEPLTGEDEYFIRDLDSTVRTEYDKARGDIVKAFRRRFLKNEEVAALDAILTKAPKFAPAYYWRAYAYVAVRRTEEARRCLSEAIKLNPDFIEAYNGLAQLCLDERDLEEAMRQVKKALELAPGNGSALGIGGYLKFVMGDKDGAQKDLEIAHTLEPTDETVTRYQRNVINVQKGPQHLGCKYVKTFPHYVVMTDMSMDKTNLYGTRLEAAYKHYSEVFKEFFVEDSSRPKPRVAIFNTREAYLTYGELTLSNRQEWTLGYFHPLYRELLLFEDVDIEATLQTLYHEAFHQFMGMMIAKTPYWYNEGIAEYMGALKIEVTKTQSKVIDRARVLDGRLKVLKMAQGKGIKFKDIMMQSPGEFYSGPVSFKYAQVWSMVHFFYEYEGGKYRPKIDAYFRTLRTGGDREKAFQAGFGDVDLDAVQNEWSAYVIKMEPLKK